MSDRGDIDRVREASDLVELMSEITKVRKSGRSFMAICPFHQEKTPSMSVDRARGLYHCFGCGEGGNVFTFVQKTQGVDFPEAVDILARKAGVTVVRDPGAAKRRGRRAAAVEAIRRAVEVYHERLKKSSEAAPARAYLRGRGYGADVVDEWRIGFSGTDWDTLSRALATAGASEEAMIDGGLSRQGGRGLFDVFRGRLMFPIHDVRGDPVGFGARRVEEVGAQSTSNPVAKYVNSADSVVYNKARVLFGLDRARREMAAEGRAVIVEGYTDVIAMHQAGVATAVAACGTALGDGHLDLVRRFTENVVLAFDSDEAGARAALRSDDLESRFRLDLDLRVAVMPDGLDPADLVQEGRSSELAAAVESARPLLEHRIEREVARHDLSGPEGRARALHAAAAHLRRVRDVIAEPEYRRFAARLIGVDLETVDRAVRAGRAPAMSAAGAAQAPLDRAESELLRVVLAKPPGSDEVSESDFEDERLSAAFAAVADELAAGGPGAPVDVSAVADPDLQAILRSLVMDPRPLPKWSDMSARLRRRRLEAMIREADARLADLEQGTDAHSRWLRRLVSLQMEKRAVGGS